MPEVHLDLGLHPRQLQALETDATDLLFGGATEGGKSHFLRCALIIWCLDVPNLSCVLIRKKISDILNGHVEGRSGFKALLAPLVDLKKVTITQDGIKFWNGSQIYFQHCQDERQFDSAQGIERQVLAIDEATQISERLIRFFRTWVRMPVEMVDEIPERWRHKFPCIICTANPIGASVGYFRREYVQARPHEAIEPIYGFKRQYMLSRFSDNPSIDVEAHKGRMHGLGDESLAKALDDGDWNALVGDFFPEWSEERHVVPDLIPPSHWTRFRTFDWGTADPFAFYQCALSDGQSFKDSFGRTRWFPRGALVIYNEWYGCDPQDPSKGNRMRNEDIAEGIWNRTEPAHRDTPIITDSLPFQDRGGQTIAQTFAETFRKLHCSATLILGDTSRVTGWSQLRSRLIGRQIDSNDPTRTPMLYVTQSCKYARDYIPALTRHPSENKKEDAAEHGEATHSCFTSDTEILTPSGIKTIGALNIGDEVIAGDGQARRISAVGLTRKNTKVIKLLFSDGKEIVCTPDHQFLTLDGWKEAKTLHAMRFACMVKPWKYGLFQQRSKNLTGLSIPNAKGIFSEIRRAFIGQFGNTITDRFLKGITSTISTTIQTITTSTTYNYLKALFISLCIRTPQLGERTLGKQSRRQSQRLLNGIALKLASNGIRSSISKRGTLCIERCLSYVRDAVRNTRLLQILAPYSVPAYANSNIIDAQSERCASVLTVSRISTATSTTDLKPALNHAQRNLDGEKVYCLAIVEEAKQDVYCLTEPVTHSFTLANGIVVANCDAIRLACMAHTIVKSKVNPLTIEQQFNIRPSGKRLLGEDYKRFFV